MRVKVIGLAISVILVLQLPTPLQAAEIPLGASGGIYTVAGQVNRSIALQFLVDPGAGVVVIPLSVLRQLVHNGTLTDSDIIGIGTAQLADSSLYLTARVRLRELRIGDVIATDVPAAVAPNLSQPLLGQSFLRRFAAVTIDNRRHVLILSEDGPAPYGRSPAAAWVAPYPSSPTLPQSGGTHSWPGYYPGSGQ